MAAGGGGGGGDGDAETTAAWESHLADEIAQEALAREKRERAACEEGLSEAYNAHLKMLVEAQGAGGASDADKSKSGRFIKKLQR